MTVMSAKVVKALSALDAISTQYILRQRIRQKKTAPVWRLPHIWGIKTGCRTKCVRSASNSIHSPKPLLGIQLLSSTCSAMPRPLPQIAPVLLFSNLVESARDLYQKIKPRQKAGTPFALDQSSIAFNKKVMRPLNRRSRTVIYSGV